jgi:hypothetical protein
MWRVMRDDLILFDFLMKDIDLVGKPADLIQDGLHVNPLECIAIIVYLWLALKLLADRPHLPTGYVVLLLSDNASAISWMRSAGKCRDPGVCHLARLAAALLVRACSATTLFQTGHIPEVQNDEADCLSA